MSQAFMASAPPTSKSNPSTPATPDHNRKRARPTKSCLECRRKKLKCDRVQPCMQCKKLGRETLCVYAHGPPGTPDSDHDHSRGVKRPRVEVSKLTSWGNGVSRNNEVRQNVHDNPATRWPDSLTTSTEEITAENNTRTSKALGRVIVKGSRSRYVGLGDRLSLLDHFSDEKQFLKGSFRDRAPALQELLAYHEAFSSKQKPLKPYPTDGEAIFAKMLSILPENSVIETLVSRYVLNLENVLRVLHIPKFLDQVEEIKRKRNPPNPALPTEVLPQLLGVLVISSRLSDPNELGFQQLPESLISQYMALLKTFLETLEGKRRITLCAVRLQTLLLIANIGITSHAPQLWNESGSLVKIAMTMGMHRDPEELTKITKFEKEQRRKIWQTIVELDLQISLACGLPPSIQPLDFTSIRLVNVDDYDLTEDMLEYPVPKPRGVWTDASPQIILASSIQERLDTAHILARNINMERDAIDLLDRARSLERSQQALQSIIPPRSKPQHTLFSDLVMDMFIRRFSLALYRSVALSELSPQYPDARKGALRGSVAILSHIDALDPAIADLDTIKSKNYLNLFHVMFKNDINQAALLLCYEIRSFNSPDRERSALYDDSVPWTKHSLTRIVENTLNSHLQRLGELGSDLRMIIPLSIVLQSVRSDGSPKGRHQMMIRGTERVLAACRKARPDVQVPFTINPELSHAEESTVRIPTTIAPSGSRHGWNPSIIVMPRYPDLTQEQFDNLLVDKNPTEVENSDFWLSDWLADYI